ncbi:MAG: FtsH protease activity modulator HflK [Bdellovibrionales bacterium]|jgi:modulator of FtsH protease HflK|nr:FtsH protease activity modulator HflK [Bdellovibrionales bacterium]MBT3526026.1 FtsH protease activity modulator HflK [Bdellovibrionales bacterium]MBT7767497.1 FtsH protease activity modulator HflK [Bdellovibrionales bacterium]
MRQYNDPNDFINDMNRFKMEFKRNGKFAAVIVLIIVVAIGIFSSFYTVQPDEEAVVLRFGRYLDTNPPGLHFKVPMGVDKVIKVRTKRVHQAEFGFRTKNSARRRSSYSNTNFDDESLMLTGDLNVAIVEWVVQFQIADPYKFLFQTSSPERNIRDVSESIMRRVVGDRSVTEVLTTGRVEIGSKAQELIQEVLDRYDLGIRVVTVKLQDVNPPDVVKASFNEVNEAKQEQEKVINQAEEAYNKIIPEARGKANKLISEAEGIGKAVVNRAYGDAEKFLAILTEYRKAPQITRKRIYLETLEGIYSKLNNLTIVDSKIKGLLPIFQSNSGNSTTKQ